MSTPIHIDGSLGEGGGQIVRSSLALALVTGRPVTIDRIRARRPRPGLLQQHLTAVNAAAEISDGAVSGAGVGSRSITFEPHAIRPGEYRFSIGSAGSTTLVLQTVLPALMLAEGPSSLILEGGTHNPWAPPFDALERAFVPIINRMGPRVRLELDRPGFFPAGGGRIRAHIEPAEGLGGFDLCERGAVARCRAKVLISNLPEHIVRREIGTIVDRTGWNADCCAICDVHAAGPGNVVLIEVVSENVTEVFTAFGQKGVKAERVAADAADQALDYLDSGVPVGPYLADQLMLPLGISAWQAGGSAGRQRGGSYRTLPLSGHSTTHIELLRDFLGISIEVEPSAADRNCTVRIK